MLTNYLRGLLLLLSLGFVGVTASSGGEFYRWVDRNGVVHFTDNPHNIPSEQRNTLSRIRFQGNPRATEEPVSAVPTKASVPIEKRGQVVVIEATINHKTAAKFVVDTGASYTMISSATARELAIDANPSRQTMPFQTANGVIQAPLTNLDSVTVGGMEIKNVTAAIHDVIPDTKVAGLLGLNFLSNFRMDIDTQKGLLHLEKK
jgi:clan AA aspartic protease (TIGR02281 family)